MRHSTVIIDITPVATFCEITTLPMLYPSFAVTCDRSGERSDDESELGLVETGVKQHQNNIFRNQRFLTFNT